MDKSAPLLQTLYERLAPRKKTAVKQLLKHGSVRVNGKIITSHLYDLKPGDKIDFLSKGEAAAERTKKFYRFSVIHEDEHILVVDKPVGLLTVSTETEKERTLYFQLTEYVRAKNPRSRIFIVHRLDRDTSGLLVFARNVSSKTFLQAHWDKAVKKYAAVAEGVLKETQGVLRSHLREDSFRRVYAAPENSRGSKAAATRYRVLETGGGYSFLDLQLQTGRKNQIRVQLSEIGHPIAGDFKYGATANPAGRIALHAYSLSFTHPATEKPVSFQSEIPPAFKALLRPVPGR